MASKPTVSDNVIFLTLENSKNLALKTVKKLGFDCFEIKKRVFADGEIIVDIPCSVREKDVFLFQSTNSPANENLMELFITIDALTRSAAKSISLIMPYFGYARQDRKARGRQPITASLIANLISKLKVKRVITFDLHSPQIQGFFEIPLVHVSALPILIANLMKTEIRDFVLVAPDYGGHRRVQELNQYLDRYVAVVDKKRPIDNDIKVNFILGSVKDQNVLLIDDLIDTGNTMLKTMRFLKSKGAKSIYVVGTHPIFSKNSLANFQAAYKEKLFDVLIVSDTINIPNAKNYPFLKIVSVAEILSKSLDIIFHGGSVSQLCQKYLDQLRTYEK